jgi:hypothetical protein
MTCSIFPLAGSAESGFSRSVDCVSLSAFAPNTGRCDRRLKPKRAPYGARIAVTRRLMRLKAKGTPFMTPKHKPVGYDTDSGIALVFDTLCDRGHAPEQVANLLDEYTGDLWLEVFGPAIDNAAELIGTTAYPEN